MNTTYMTCDAKLWGKTRNADDESVGRPKIDNWTKLKKEMRDQFLPSNASWFARDKLKRLRQNGMEDWAQNELRRQNVEDLPEAIDVVDSLVDFRSTRPTIDVPSTLESNKNG
ncbi:hypothetical protein KY290_012888 [Solanum tuberosum]|uniref:Retrotransposon gag domain-containing protein n=1 Tax=Solanum tuberosum TaxID=4113 RepID=A0ABQ7VK46_SOLTU|nr:hypothetical protein KY285_012638 [Solanum tuberosum]KAH0768907.1 hypothetical protein KY290_012888 [Solanum tuberosum]